MAKESPPLIFGREPTGNGLNFDEILSSMGVSDLNIGSDDSDDDQTHKGASIIQSKSEVLKLQLKTPKPVIETSSDSDAAPSAFPSEPVKLSPEEIKLEEIKSIEQSVRIASSEDEAKRTYK